MKIEKVSEYVGAEIHDITIRNIRNPEIRAQVLQALHDNELLIFKHLEISPGEQVELARLIGEPVPFVMNQYRHPEHPEIMISSNEVVDGKAYGVPRVGNFWHQDSSYTDNPTTYTLLHGITIPASSGDTLFSSARDVYARLPEAWKKKIDGRHAVHTVRKRFKVRPEHVGYSIAEIMQQAEKLHPPVEHPLVKLDARTGRRYLYGARDYLDYVIGFDANENHDFLTLLEELVTDSRYVYRHKWTKGDLLLWKTETAYHAVTHVEDNQARTVHRVAVK
ncbi:TauD/TfdA dioxygenase family protein [Burkholderia stagnalis]|uniref:TauD/TfdA dioxygenase family protein n=1 Tax=Burkholderia stagnalis TaxID=1503054 RepID=UPI000756C512|nr:TauD/TfdA family dioxygenase [Burkholderia stagnalis]KVM74842.1 taurine dioxygenase [Burkholderia stagnalis]KVN17311.1 taurine dioxygenase [Burkholderia stagnalis]KVO56957.1 taurine dioxygenase [Burkholderia stagnalis]KVP11238.1 taurine dioxygenase [Burkholderia stagnalis]KVW92477.1 taurine dioxygenase [Burkholderia stagnalis]